MGYTLDSSQKAPLLDDDGNPIPTADLSGGGGPAPWGVGLAATIQDNGAGFLECVGNSSGTATFALVQVSTGTLVSHDVTVTASPFDWTLGEPVAK